MTKTKSIDSMKYACLFFMKVVFTTMPFVGLSQDAECKAALKIIDDVNSNFRKGIYIYSPRRVKVYTDNDSTKYKIKGKNKDIGKLIKITNIECSEDVHGGYLITKEVLDEWNTWLIRNCRKKE